MSTPPPPPPPPPPAPPPPAPAPPAAPPSPPGPTAVAAPPPLSPAVVAASGATASSAGGGTPKWLIALAVVGALALAGAVGAAVAVALTGDDGDAESASTTPPAVATTSPPLELRVRVEEPTGARESVDTDVTEVAVSDSPGTSSAEPELVENASPGAEADTRTKDGDADADGDREVADEPLVEGDGEADGLGEQDSSGQDDAGQDEAGQDEAGQDEAGQERDEQDGAGQHADGEGDAQSDDASADAVAESKAVVRDGQIFLEGAVPSAEAGAAIEALAAEILGPDNVFNDYVVDPRAGDPNLGNITVEDTINFATDSDVVLPEAETLLNQGLALLNLRPAMTIHIVGHTDSRGSSESNHELSTRRAEAVKEWFVERGVDPSRLTTEGAGEDEPIADNDTADGRRLNRRIQFFLENILG